MHDTRQKIYRNGRWDKNWAITFVAMPATPAPPRLGRAAIQHWRGVCNLYLLIGARAMLNLLSWSSFFHHHYHQHLFTSRAQGVCVCVSVCPAFCCCFSFSFPQCTALAWRCAPLAADLCLVLCDRPKLWSLADYNSINNKKKTGEGQIRTP